MDPRELRRRAAELAEEVERAREALAKAEAEAALAQERAEAVREATEQSTADLVRRVCRLLLHETSDAELRALHGIQDRKELMRRIMRKLMA
jgi:cell division septum initiation protein DivIVA